MPPWGFEAASDLGMTPVGGCLREDLRMCGQSCWACLLLVSFSVEREQRRKECSNFRLGLLTPHLRADAGAKLILFARVHVRTVLCMAKRWRCKDIWTCVSNVEHVQATSRWKPARSLNIC